MSQPISLSPLPSPPPSPPRSWLRWLILAALVLVLGLGAWWAWKHWGGGAQKVDEPIFATVQRGDVEDLVGATGTLQPRDFVDVGAQVSGQLKKLHVEVGNEVTQGQLLAEIDAEQSAARVEANQAALRAQQATLVERQANLAKAERDLQRQRNLMAEEATTTEQMQNAETAVRTATTQLNATRAQIEQQQASMRVEEANLKFTKIYAPISGTVVSIAARQGQTLNASQSAPIVMRIADLSTMTVQTQVGEADVSKLRTGMSSYFTTLGSPGRRWYGNLRKIEPTPTVTNNVVLYNALFDVANPNKALMSQMTAQVFFIVSEARSVIVVPLSALTFQRGASRGPTQNAAGASGTQGAAGAKSAAAPDAAKAPVAEKAQGRRGKGGERQRGERNNAAGAEQPAGQERASGQAQPAPRRATVKIANPDGSVTEREVMVGTSSRVSAEILSGLNEGESIVIGIKVADAPQRPANAGAPVGAGAPGGGAFKGIPGGGRK